MSLVIVAPTIVHLIPRVFVDIRPAQADNFIS
jgi:hypothetical protein